MVLQRVGEGRDMKFLRALLVKFTYPANMTTHESDAPVLQFNGPYGNPRLNEKWWQAKDYLKHRQRKLLSAGGHNE